MIIKELEERGILSAMTDESELRKELNSGRKLTLYCGFDPTADSLHLGSLLPLMNMKRFLDHGHKVIALIGGATGLIGDPSFKASERKLNSPDVVNGFKRKIEFQIRSILGDKVIIVDNLKWVENLNVLDFLRDTGKYFSVNTMLNKDSVKQRLNRDGEGISFTEFSYQLLQGLDFLKLKEIYDCNLQIGGSDQMGNITAGTNLIHRKMGNKEQAFGLTTKLITKSDGSKFGKTESGTIWLSKEKTSPFDLFQFLLKTDDNDVYDYLKFFSSLSVDEINRIELEDKDRRPIAQLLLAESVTLLLHGEDGLLEAKNVTEAMMSGDFKSLSLSLIEKIVLGLDSVEVEDGVELTTALVESKLSPSKTRSRTFIKNNAISVNGIPSNQDVKLTKLDTIYDKFIFLKRGKRSLSCVILKK